MMYLMPWKIYESLWPALIACKQEDVRKILGTA